MPTNLQRYITGIVPYEHDMALDICLDEFFKPGYCIEMCRACSNYGQRWGCPPLEGDFAINFAAYNRIRIHAIQIMLADDTPADVALLSDIMQSVRAVREARLLELEQLYDGHAALFTGMCPHCPGMPCARQEGGSCRHPALVRPSLEALGFDLNAIAREIFGIELQWCRDGRAPQYLLLIGAVFNTAKNGI